jgi:hypothetical protein
MSGKSKRTNSISMWTNLDGRVVFLRVSIDRRMVIRGLHIRLLLDAATLRMFGGRQYAAIMFVTCYFFLFRLELLAREISNGTNGIVDGPVHSTRSLATRYLEQSMRMSFQHSIISSWLLARKLHALVPSAPKRHLKEPVLIVPWPSGVHSTWNLLIRECVSEAGPRVHKGRNKLQEVC